MMVENVQAELLLIPTEHLTSLLVFDIDGDNDLDVFSVENHGETLRWHQNKGNEFAAHIIQSQTTEADRWINMDLDADGDQDLLSVSFSNNSVTWFANDGLGNFSISDDEDTEVITIDSDQDGTADEIQMRYNNQSVSWFRTTEEQFAYNTTLWEFGNERWFLKSKLNLANQPERLDDYGVLNITAFKSWRVNQKYILWFMGINNALGTPYISGGYEQSRSANYRSLSEDVGAPIRRFGPKYWHGRDTTFFMNVSLRF
ncbi:MAG: FG-GAP repeat domain-containing protein [Flavobacteriaceae bacterium]